MKPTELPEFRVRGLRDFLDNRTEYIFWRADDGVFGNHSVDVAARHIDAEVRRWQLADLFYVSPNMSQLASDAVDSMPDFELRVEDPPSPFGLIYFSPPSSAKTVEPVVITWGLVNFQGNPVILEEGTERGVWFTAYTIKSGLVETRLDQWLAFGSSRPDPRLTVEGMSRNEGERLVRCSWLLMQQPHIAEAQYAPAPERHSEKRIKRAGFDVRPVRIITLRHAASGSIATGGHEYQHRWIVRSHWRNHWYPKQKRHVPTLIPAHIKGPEGKPMLSGEKVYAWIR